MGKNPLEQENAKRGAAVFQQSCAYCHGKNADGGSEAPNLIRSLLVRHDKGGDLIGPVIQEGRPDRGMPAIRLPAEQAADVVTYLHALLSLSDSAAIRALRAVTHSNCCSREMRNKARHSLTARAAVPNVIQPRVTWRTSPPGIRR